jgi:hypothetical protein
MIRQLSPHNTRLRLDALLTDLALYAKGLCPEAQVEASALQYELQFCKVRNRQGPP